MNAFKALTFIALFALSAQVAAVTYDIDFTRSTYQVQSGDTIDDLVAAHLAGTVLANQALAGLSGLETTAFISGNTNDHSIMMSTTFTLAGDTQYEFQVGADWGRGGGIAIYDNNSGSKVSEQIFAKDIWWGRSWSNSDVISTSFDFSAGDWTIVWVGFEGCCSGSTSIRFAENGGTFADLTAANFLPGSMVSTSAVVPVPGAHYLFLSGVLALAAARKRG